MNQTESKLQIYLVHINHVFMGKR